MRRFIDGKVEDWFIEPITWIPSEHNPSKLIAHRWNGREWHELVYVRFVASPYWQRRKESGADAPHR